MLVIDFLLLLCKPGSNVGAMLVSTSKSTVGLDLMASESESESESDSASVNVNVGYGCWLQLYYTFNCTSSFSGLYLL